MGGKAAIDENAALPADELVEQAAENAQEEAAVVPESEEKPVVSESETPAVSEEKAKPAKAGKGGLPFTVKDGRVTVFSKDRAGKKIIAKTGEIIVFDADGKASVREADALYLSKFGDVSFE